jgi:glycosyltransferase involved in cell wall biosynthesis
MSTADDHDQMNGGVRNGGTSAPRPLLIIHSSDEMYGSDRMVLELIAALPPSERKRVVVWLPSDSGHGETPLCHRLLELGVTFDHVELPILRRRYLNARGLWGLATRARVGRRRLALLDPGDIVFATSATLPLAPLVPWGRGTRTSLYLQEIWPRNESRVLGALASNVNRVIAISEAARASIPPSLRKRAVVVPNGTGDPDVYTPVDPTAADLVFLIASRWDTWKGHEVLLKAWDQADCPGRLVIIGGPSAMGNSVDVPELVGNSLRPESIEVRGKVTDVGSIIDAADFMIVPSTLPEPFGLVAIEAFARGRGVVASANGGLLEIVQDGAGWLVEPGDVQALAARLKSLTREDAVRAGAAARRRYEQQYSQEAFRSSMRAAFAEVLTESSND